MICRLRTFKLYHFACGPHHRKDEQTFEELIMQTQSLPISRFDIMDGDEIFVDPWGWISECRRKSAVLPDFQINNCVNKEDKCFAKLKVFLVFLFSIKDMEILFTKC